MSRDVFQPTTVEHRRTYASNMREITRPDGSIVKGKTRLDGLVSPLRRLEFLFENPNASKTNRTAKEKFAELKAKFEPKNSTNADIQYEMIDENGNQLPIDGIENIIKMSGVSARQFEQNDGTLVREYVITDPRLVSQVREKRFPPPPPPPPRLARRPSTTPSNLTEVQNVEQHRPYRFVTSTGRQIDFTVTEIVDAEDFSPIVTEPIIDWSVLREQDPDGQIDPEFIRQFIYQRHQAELQSLSTTFPSK